MTDDWLQRQWFISNVYIYRFVFWECMCLLVNKRVHINLHMYNVCIYHTLNTRGSRLQDNSILLQWRTFSEVTEFNYFRNWKVRRNFIYRHPVVLNPQRIVFNLRRGKCEWSCIYRPVSLHVSSFEKNVPHFVVAEGLFFHFSFQLYFLLAIFCQRLDFNEFECIWNRL